MQPYPAAGNMTEKSAVVLRQRMGAISVMTYFDSLKAVLDSVERSQKESIKKAADYIAECLTTGHMLFTFGTGHSSLLAMEIFYRAGGFASVYPILDENLLLHKSASESSVLERKEGTGTELIRKSGCGEGDVIIIISNSGRNCVPVEAAVEAHARGTVVISLTSMNHSQNTTPRNPFHKRLFEVSDVVLDNCGTIGDASLENRETGIRFAPTSTAVGTAILWETVRMAIDGIVERGERPEVFQSANIDGGDAYNASLLQKYKGRIPSL